MAIDEFKKCESCGDYLYECKCINPEDIYEELKQLKEDLHNLVEKQLKEEMSPEHWADRIEQLLNREG